MKKITIIVGAFLLIGFTTLIDSCSTSAMISAKSGAQIWGENCIRCHNVTSPATFSDVEWDVAALHMQIRANLTVEETRKVVEFLKASN